MMIKRANLLARVVVSIALAGVLLAPPAARLHVVSADEQKPQVDFGIAGLAQEIRKLQTTGRMIHTTAHPDDEDGGMLTFESRGAGATVLLMTLNRGEGGQNKTGSELFDALGVLRTLELLAADDYYGVEQRFSRVVDFGFSKNAEETFTQWKGHEIPLADMVRVIRTFRPDVLVSRFQGAPRDGHGHHQAAGILTPEAFKAAGNPNRFPEQIKEGLVPWQPKKLYTDNVRPGEDYTVRVDTGTYDPLLGMSYQQFALEGLAHQLSQGSGGFRVPPGHHYSYYKLLDSIVPTAGSKGGHEQSFFDGIDTSLVGLASRLGPEEQKVAFLKPALSDLQGTVSQAADALTPDNPARAASPLLAGLKIVKGIIGNIEAADISPPAKLDLLTSLRTKEEQFARAANLALGIDLDVSVDPPKAQSGGGPVEGPAPQQTFGIAVPGQTFTLTARFYNRSPRPVTPHDIKLETPDGWKTEVLKSDLKTLNQDDSSEVQFKVTVAEDAAYTRPYWHRDNTQQAIYHIDTPLYVTLPFPPYPVHAIATYSLANADGEVRSVAEVKYVDPLYGQGERPLAVGPPISLEVNPETGIIPVGGASGESGREPEDEVTVGVRNNSPGAANATLRLEAPKGWKVEPKKIDLQFSRAGEFASYKFAVRPAALSEARYDVRAVADYAGKEYSEGYEIVGRHDLGSFYYYHPAVEHISSVSVRAPEGLRVGYIMGAGDDIPLVLKQLGINVQTISAGELASGDLSKYDTIVLGIRAYDVRSDVRDNNRRLLDFVSRGGTLVVQYNQSVGSFNAGGYTPYPATATTKRVTVEEAPVNILAPNDSVFNYPNKIAEKDFSGWVQERGTYFMDKWDSHYQPLLSSHDPGEDPLDGGLLRASYGKGVYIYSGYAFFRQLPAGVPGAIRLFVNIISAGHAK